ncbi:hypothetical protein HOV35_gp31 [Escherichia phage Sortsne]|uniref:Uncharacterized protein n=1 Tax=Escherichia phage Sortsne TaxID=2562456 RepID=A0A4D6E0J3_9CAUD|nr:hypothetical protein HOV35_gp31 [Escherichia phage Sortsne]QBZ71596.1 hypothetical protein [Escherichia phage Sortsne]
MWMNVLMSGLAEGLAVALNLFNVQPAPALAARLSLVMYSINSGNIPPELEEMEQPPEPEGPINKSQPSPLAMHLIKRDLMAHKGRQRRTVTESRAELISPDKPTLTPKPPKTGGS